MALQALQSSGVAFRRILSHFPEELSLAFAYGSGVYRQAGPSSNQKNVMLDFVFTVDDPVAWHSKNLKKNRNHYSFLKVLGAKVITTVQNNYGAGVYYNPLIMCDGKLIKYGVISTSILIDDLLNWNNLYIAGRLQKPVKIIAMNENVTLRSALDKNLKSAVTAAFLMLPESFSEEDLFIAIAGLSYSGDFRMMVGEDKTKVLNIVKPNIVHFRELYGNILQENPQVVYKIQQGRLEIDKSPEGQFTQLMTLPKTLQQQINRIMDPPGKNRDVEETLFQLAHDPDCGEVMRLGLSAIVRPSSIRQSTKGVFTADQLAEVLLQGSPEQAEKLKCKPKARCQTADLGDIPERYQKHPSEQKYLKPLRVCKPSNLHAASHASTKREKILADIEADEENLKEKRWPYLSPKHKSPVRSASAKRVPYDCNPLMPTVSSRGRKQATRKSEKEKMREYRQEQEERRKIKKQASTI
ncbi:MMP37-like protein, mitochondrial [Pteropus alecto]|uniref:Phosphatidate cytidylyltransferase, mitochondrial n=1 Tax=Pteropus alecto TaxID=9402 RepID=L5K8R4_PTEAL|nr:MMP37-like protein, mitochondrial [Pteropus alecto]